MVNIGKDLQGNELGTGVSQVEKNNMYLYRKNFKGKYYFKYSKSLEKVLNYKEKIESMIFDETHSLIPENAKLGYVYFITDGEFCKIGHTLDINKRLKTLQTANAKKLEVLMKIETFDYYNLEAHLHRLFKKYKIFGEWYDIIFLFEKDKKKRVG